MTTKRIPLSQLGRELEREARRIEGAVTKAIARTARKGAPVIRKRIPRAFGDLAESVHATDTAIVVDAPHAHAFEVGSSPHRPPLEPLIAWVRRRAVQGLTAGGYRTSRSKKVEAQAKSIARMVRSLRNDDGSTPIDAPEQIARAIADKIAREGTPPHWFARESLPEIFELLDQEITTEIKKG